MKGYRLSRFKGYRALIHYSWIVFVKELTESLRDRKALFHTLLTGPLLAPVIFALIIHLMVSREVQRAERPLPLPVSGMENAPSLMDFLRQQGAELKPSPPYPEMAVRQQESDVVLRVTEDYPRAWKRGDPAPVEIIYDSSQRDAAGSVARVRAMLDAYSRQTGALRLMARGVPATTVIPLRPVVLDQSTPQSRSGILFGLLPYFFILGGFVGGMALAIDATAGERERQSLEPLLSTPAPRASLVLGKTLATSILGIASVVMGLLAFSILAPTLPVAKLGMALDFGPAFLLTALAVLVPLVFLLATLQNAVSAFASSHREAQTYLSLLMFIPSLPSLILAVVPVKISWSILAVPVAGQQMLLVRALRGESVSFDLWLWSSFVTLMLSMAVIRFTCRRYQSERLSSV